MAEAYRARSSFAIPGPGGLPRVITEGAILAAGDPAVKAHKELFQPMSEHIEQATQAPGEVRPVAIPSEGRAGWRSRKEGEHMPHALPPEHEDSPASPFAPGQPAAGIVADDVPDEQNPGGGIKAADAPRIENTPPEPQTPLQEANAEAQAEANEGSRKSSGRKSK